MYILFVKGKNGEDVFSAFFLFYHFSPTHTPATSRGLFLQRWHIKESSFSFGMCGWGEKWKPGGLWSTDFPPLSPVRLHTDFYVSDSEKEGERRCVHMTVYMFRTSLCEDKNMLITWWYQHIVCERRNVRLEKKERKGKKGKRGPDERQIFFSLVDLLTGYFVALRRHK